MKKGNYFYAMKLPEFVLIEHPTETKGKVLIMQTFAPYIIGQVWKFDNIHDQNRFHSRFAKTTPLAKANNYYISANVYGSLEEINNIEDNRWLTRILCDMLNFYHEERIERKPGYYNRYRIDKADHPHDS